MLWYVDVLGYLITKKFPLGVAAFIVWPETTKLRLLTTTHHIFYIPLCLYLLRG